jgi:hypothetical protein
MATIILSKRGMALLMIDSCPLVIGSKEPGNTAIFFMLRRICTCKSK